MVLNRPKLLLGIETLSVGGAESFVILLANALRDDFEVSVFVVYGKKIDMRLLERQKNDFKIEACTLPFEFFLGKIDGVLFRLNIDFSVRNVLVKRFLKRLIEKDQFNLLHSNQFKVDYIFSEVNLSFGIPHITTIHGDYINFFRQMSEGRLRYLNFEKKARLVLESISRIAYIAEYQLDFLIETLQLVKVREKCIKIYNGIILPSRNLVEKTELIKDPVFTFGMVARGIPEKGWKTAIQAFLLLNSPNTRLILVGESKYLDELKALYNDSRIVFAGFAVNPQEWISKFDVGLLPTTFASESLPTSIIEYMAMGKPVIASDKGEIRTMLEKNGEACGIVLSVRDNQIGERELAVAMKLLSRDRELYQKMTHNAKNFVASFDIKNCADAYSRIYHSLMQSKP